MFEMELSRLSTPESYFEQLREELLPKRDRMAAMLSDIGMVPIVPEGGYFMVADISHLGRPIGPRDATPKRYFRKLQMANVVFVWRTGGILVAAYY